VCRQILEYPSNHVKTVLFLVFFWYYLNSGVPPSFFETNSVPRDEKVENHWSTETVIKTASKLFDSIPVKLGSTFKSETRDSVNLGFFDNSNSFIPNPMTRSNFISSGRCEIQLLHKSSKDHLERKLKYYFKILVQSPKGHMKIYIFYLRPLGALRLF